MSLYVPTWVVVLVLLWLPVVLGWVCTPKSSGGFMDFSGLFGLMAFAVTAAACWTGLIVWMVMR